MVRHHQAWRLVTSIWIHAGVVHLLANMISLLFIGIRLEREFGFGTFSLSLPHFRYLIIVFAVLKTQISLFCGVLVDDFHV